jgi:hypothetical protein
MTDKKPRTAPDEEITRNLTEGVQAFRKGGEKAAREVFRKIVERNKRRSSPAKE